MNKTIFLMVLFLLNSVFALNMEVYLNSGNINIAYFFDTNKNTYSVPITDLKELTTIKSNVDFNYSITKNRINFHFFKTPAVVYLEYQLNAMEIGDDYYQKTIALDFNDNVFVKIFSDDNIYLIYPEFKDANLYYYNNFNKKVFFTIRVKKENYSYFLAFFVSIIIIIYFSIKWIKKYLFYFKVKNSLTDIEKRVILLLLKQNGLIQQTIATSLKVSKSRISKVLVKMEQKNLLKIIKVGKVKKVYINYKILI